MTDETEPDGPEVDHHARTQIAVLAQRMTDHDRHCAERYSDITTALDTLGKRWWMAVVGLIGTLLASLGTLATIIMQSLGPN